MLAEALDVANVVIGESTELLNHFFLGIGILVRTDVHALAAENGVRAFEIFLEESVEEGVSFRIEEIEVVHSVVFTGDFGLIVCKCQGVSRRIDFGNDFNVVLLGVDLKIDELLLGVVAVASGKTGIGFALQAESGLCLVPIVVEVLTEAVVVEVNLQGVHLVISHGFHKLVHILDGEELATYVQHETTQFIFGYIGRYAARELTVLVLLGNLQQRACCPIGTLRSGSFHVSCLADVEVVALFAQRSIGGEFHHEIAGACFFVDSHFQFLAKHLGIISNKGFGHAHQLLIFAFHHHTTFGSKVAFASLPCLKFRHHKRFLVFGIKCCRNDQHYCTEAITHQ